MGPDKHFGSDRASSKQPVLPLDGAAKPESLFRPESTFPA